MRRALALVALAISLFAAAWTARAEGTDAGNYHVAFVRPGAGVYNHGVTLVAAVGTNVLVGSPAEISAADVYDGRTGALLHHFPSFYGLDDSAFGVGVASSSRGYLIGEPQHNEVYLFNRRFRLRLALKPPADSQSLAFGNAVAEAYRTIVVGAPFSKTASPRSTRTGRDVPLRQ